MGCTITPYSCSEVMGGTAQYHVNVSYLDGVEDVNVEVKQKYPLNSTILSNPYLFVAWTLVDDINDPVRFNQPIPDDQVLWNSTSNTDPIPLATAYREQNIRSIADALAISLGGAIEAKGNGAGNGFVGEFIGNTLITQTPWVNTNVSYYGATYDFSELTASLFEQMLRNVTMSMLTRPNTNAYANVTKTPWRNAYSFARKDSLIAAYAVSLIVSALFIAMGIFALFKNGVAAETGGFMQVLCTTTGDFLDINREASKCSTGGAANFSEKLKDMRVRFGEISGNEESDGAPRAGFGTEKEMVPVRDRG
ncbi:uncharacterized protein LTHEOB_4187 [Neofusicoccum parvum]|nr:uncharacterized protein LTHEOB_4187 [Neofusicoccum parvum]